MKLLDGVEGDAVLSPDGRYRYLLTRVRHWQGPSIMWICLNPSTADAESDDMTLRRIQSYSSAWGFSRVYVTNLFGFRATDPKELYGVVDPVGPGNDDVIESVLIGAPRSTLTVVAAWGTWGAKFLYRVQVMMNLVARHDLSLHRLGATTKDGHPRHPSRQPDGLKLEVHW